MHGGQAHTCTSSRRENLLRRNESPSLQQRLTLIVDKTVSTPVCVCGVQIVLLNEVGKGAKHPARTIPGPLKRHIAAMQQGFFRKNDEVLQQLYGLSSSLVQLGYIVGAVVVAA